MLGSCLHTDMKLRYPLVTLRWLAALVGGVDLDSLRGCFTDGTFGHSLEHICSCLTIRERWNGADKVASRPKAPLILDR